MNIHEFREIDARYRNEKPKLFLHSTTDPRASVEQLEVVESEIGVCLPESYRVFLKEFGGGEYGLTTIFSANPESEWYLPTRQTDASSYLPEVLLSFSDDFAGGLYVMKVVDGKVEDQVFYWNQDGGLALTDICDVLEFVVRHAYEPA